MTAIEFYDKNEDKQGKWGGKEWMEQYANAKLNKAIEEIERLGEEKYSAHYQHGFGKAAEIIKKQLT